MRAERELLLLKANGGYLPFGSGPNQHLRALKAVGRVRVAGEVVLASGVSIFTAIGIR